MSSQGAWAPDHLMDVAHGVGGVDAGLPPVAHVVGTTSTEDFEAAQFALVAQGGNGMCDAGLLPVVYPPSGESPDGRLGSDRMLHSDHRMVDVMEAQYADSADHGVGAPNDADLWRRGPEALAGQAGNGVSGRLLRQPAPALGPCLAAYDTEPHSEAQEYEDHRHLHGDYDEHLEADHIVEPVNNVEVPDDDPLSRTPASPSLGRDTVAELGSLDNVDSIFRTLSPLSPIREVPDANAGHHQAAPDFQDPCGPADLYHRQPDGLHGDVGETVNDALNGRGVDRAVDILRGTSSMERYQQIREKFLSSR